MFIAVLLKIAKLWKQSRCPKTNGLRKCDTHTHTHTHTHIYIHTKMEYYTALNKNEIMLFAGKWVEVEIIMLSKVSQVQKDKSCMISLIGGR
jgi:hypothetical protein